MKKEKKKWETPKLICLYRGRLEEAVLADCKVTQGAVGPLIRTCSDAAGGPKKCSLGLGT